MHATFRTQQIIVEDAAGQRQLLLEIDIDCEGCGQTQGLIHGHHLATLHYALGRIIAERPELCGEVGVVTDEITYSGVVPGAGKETRH